ncbi:DUF3953 domain-containing protein [Guptibacillus hwajinpoensis]|uniref:DUF3953 domain-containing protein n=1 Tax=Guptibacillus hwajinpoensis TaxID=208199 RepID=UPI001CFCA628|nr:DUF3953 domain-containing protein [Pseudalkalibacillus hwajinpoensis]WLR58843.1 DUF3953 domain-containing protein [Pseudalkalibacillus hwajinpoensis]
MTVFLRKMKVGIWLKILRYVLSLSTFALAVYGLITSNFEFNHIMIFLLGLTLLVMGIEELQKERKTIGILLVGVFVFSLFVSIKGFLLS